jgi:hypothetical protein
MMKRLAALLIALAVAAAPVALEACRITCASSPMPSHAPHASHAHAKHHPSSTAQPPCHETHDAGHTLSRGSAPCDHGNELTPWSLISTRTDAVALPPVHFAAAEWSDTVRLTFFGRGLLVVPLDRLALNLSVSLRI